MFEIANVNEGMGEVGSSHYEYQYEGGGTVDEDAEIAFDSPMLQKQRIEIQVFKRVHVRKAGIRTARVFVYLDFSIVGMPASLTEKFYVVERITKPMSGFPGPLTLRTLPTPLFTSRDLVLDFDTLFPP